MEFRSRPSVNGMELISHMNICLLRIELKNEMKNRIKMDGAWNENLLFYLPNLIKF